MMKSKKVQEASIELLALAHRISNEGEPLDLSDEEFTLEELVQLRSHLSAWRRGIDIVNKALAVYWDDEYAGRVYDDGINDWSLTRAKTKELVDDDMFMAFLASRDVEQLKRLFTPSRLTTVIKLSGMTPAERETFILEGRASSGYSINFRERMNDEVR